jgi:predicted PurR-regulated permease PerM
LNSKIIANGILRALAVITAIILFLYFLYQIQSVIIYLIIAGVISLIGRPIIVFLKKRLRFNDTVAVVITMIGIVGVFLGILSLFIPLIIEQSRNLALLDINLLQQNAENLYVDVINHFGINQTDVEASFKDSQFM